MVANEEVWVAMPHQGIANPLQKMSSRISQMLVSSPTVRLAVRKIRLPSSRRFSIGAAERSSTRASAASRATLATPAAMMTGLAQPRTGDSLTVYKNSARPPPASTKPATSSRPVAGLTVLGQEQQPDDQRRHAERQVHSRQSARGLIG